MRLVSETSWMETKLEILHVFDFAAMQAIYDTYYRNIPTEFTRTVNRLLTSAKPANRS